MCADIIMHGWIDGFMIASQEHHENEMAFWVSLSLNGIGYYGSATPFVSVIWVFEKLKC